MNIDDFDEVVEELLFYLHRRKFKNEKQNMIKLKKNCIFGIEFNNK